MRPLLLALAPLALTACAVTPRPGVQPPMPGYRCNLEERGDFGTITGTFEVERSGKFVSGYLGWDAGDGSFANPWITAAFFRSPDGHFSLDRGYINMMRHIWRNRPGKPPSVLNLTLELTTVPEGTQLFSPTRLASPLQRSGGPFHISTAWKDVAALARGGPHLYLVARDRKLAEVDRIELDRRIYDRAAPRIEAAMKHAEAMLAAPATHCTPVDDLIERDIII